MTWRKTWGALIEKSPISTPIDNIDNIDKTPALEEVQPENSNCVNYVNIVLERESSKFISNLHTDDQFLSTETAVDPDHREGPPYPDSLGRVKCFYCEHCKIIGAKATCRTSGESKTGIALLIECRGFAMKTVH